MNRKCLGGSIPVWQLQTGLGTSPMLKRNWLSGTWLERSCISVSDGFQVLAHMVVVSQTFPIGVS